MRPVDRVLQRLNDVRRNGAGYKACCPVAGHGKGQGDLDPSLSVKEGDDGRVLIHCLAGCSTEDVVEALSLNMADLFEHRDAERGGDGGSITSDESRYVDTGCTVEDYAKAKELPASFLVEPGNPGGAVVSLRPLPASASDAEREGDD